MTEEDRATIYGRTMLELKQCKTDDAALRSYFSNYREQLERASNALRKFLADPCCTEPIDCAAHVKDNNLRLTRADFEDQVGELIRVTRRLRELEEEVKKF
jgi:hypothetical protein